MADNRRIHEAKRLLRTTFGYEDFRAGQEEIVSSVLQGRDVLGVLPTGGGKSVCYQIPALLFPACTLVVSPLVALMTDQVQRLTQLGVPAACLHSGMPQGDVNQILFQAHQGKMKLLYVAPERLESDSFRSSLATVSLSMLAVDEAHCISEWGHDFRPSYRAISRLFEQRQRVPIVAVTATATPDVRADIVSSLALNQPSVIVRGFDRPNLTFQVEPTPHKVEYLSRIIKAHPQDPLLVYAGSRRRVDTIVDELRKRKHTVVGYHAGKPSHERTAIQQSFLEGSIPVMVATNAFGMGIDKADIRRVVHTDLTLTLESYYQEAGRAGRDGIPSTCTILYVPEDKRLMDFFIECAYPEVAQVRSVLDYIVNRAQGADRNTPLLIDAPTIAVELHEPVARVQGVLNVLTNNGIVFRTSQSGTATMTITTSFERLKEFVAHQPAHRKAASEAILRTLQGSSYEMGVTLNPVSFLRKHGISTHEFHHTVRAMLVQRLIRFREPEQGGALVLVTDYVVGGTLPVDMDSVHTRRTHAIAKLASMVTYVTTQSCKRNYILAYFGDTGPEGLCNRCSSCTRKAETTNVIGRNTQHLSSVVRSVYELHGRFGRHVVADVLTGTISERIVRFRLDRAVTWGELRNCTREYVLGILDEAVTIGFLIKSSGTFPTLAVTKQGVSASPQLPSRINLTPSGIRSVDPGVYGALVMLRDQIAEREQVTPSSILSLSAVERLSMDMPQTLADLKPGDHGSGLFLARYGTEVIEVLSKGRRSVVLGIPKVRADAEVEQVVASVAANSSLEDVARSLHITKATAAQRIQRAVEAGLPVEIERIIPTGILEQVIVFIRQHRYAKLRHVREHTEVSVDLPELRVAMAYARRELYGVPL